MEADARHLRLRTGITVPCFVRDNALDSSKNDDGAPPVLLLHAWGETHRSFDRLIPHLTGFRVYAPDLRGQGEADKPADGYSLAEQAEDAAAILDALEVPRAAVVGSSSGGYVAQQLAVAHPEKVAALVLVGSPLSLQGRPAFADEVDALTDPLDEAWVRDSLTWVSAAARRTGLVYRGPCPRRSPDACSHLERHPERPLRRYPAHRNRDHPGSHPHPVGRAGHPAPRADQETLAARIPGAVLKIYPDAAHCVLWECPERVAEDTTAFLASVRQRPAPRGAR